MAVGDSVSALKVLHPLTLASIEMQAWKCGCERRAGWEATTGKWWLCGYHEGFEDGIAAMAEHQPKEE